MLSQLDYWKGSPQAAAWFASVTTVLFAGLIWVVNRDLLWMMVVLVPPIWSPVLAHRFFDETGSSAPTTRAVGALAAGLVALLGLAVLLFLVL